MVRSGLKARIGGAWLSFVRWFDTSAGCDDSSPLDTEQKSEWLRTIPFLVMHLACLAVIWVGWSPTAVAVAVVLYLLRMFAITGFYHRYFSHRTFRTSRAFQFVMAVWGNSSVQRGALWWAAHHRLHHRHSDQEEDVHSPIVHTLYWSHMGWITSRANFATRNREIRDLTRFPELVWLNRFDTVVPIVFAAGLFGLGALLERFAPGLGTTGGQMLVWGFFISTVVLFHGTCLINSMAHLYGTRRYNTTDHSRNSLLLSLITLGEGWHNNHHHYPATARQGFFWWELDITYYGLKLLSWVGLIHDLKPVPDHVRRPTRGASVTIPATEEPALSADAEARAA